jgi:hypothetical protein
MKCIKIVGIVSLFIGAGICRASAPRAYSRWGALTRQAAMVPAVGGRFSAYTATPLRPRPGISARFSSTAPENKDLSSEWRTESAEQFDERLKKAREQNKRMLETFDFLDAETFREGLFRRAYRRLMDKAMFNDPEKQKRYEEFKIRRLESKEFNDRIAREKLTEKELARGGLTKEVPWRDPEKEARYQSHKIADELREQRWKARMEAEKLNKDTAPQSKSWTQQAQEWFRESNKK